MWLLIKRGPVSPRIETFYDHAITSSLGFCASVVCLGNSFVIEAYDKGYSGRLCLELDIDYIPMKM